MPWSRSSCSPIDVWRTMSWRTRSRRTSPRISRRAPGSCAPHVYHAGEGCEATVELCPRSPEATGLATTCAAVEDVVRRADDEGKLQVVHMTLRKESVQRGSETDNSWVQNYPRQ